MRQYKEENLSKRLVTYTLNFEGKFYIVENVPARVNSETGEELFSPETVECLQKMILEHVKPHRVIETPVFEFTEMALQ